MYQEDTDTKCHSDILYKKAFREAEKPVIKEEKYVVSAICLSRMSLQMKELLCTTSDREKLLFVLSIHFLEPHHLGRVVGVLNLIQAATGRVAGHTLDRLPVHRSADT